MATSLQKKKKRKQKKKRKKLVTLSAITETSN